MHRHPSLEFNPASAKPALVPLAQRRQLRPPIQCVYVTTTPQEAEMLAWLVAPRGIEIHRAGSVHEAGLLLGRVRCRVLLCETEFAGGTWVDVLRMVQLQHPETAVMVALSRFDGRTWVEALELGCYDVLLKPFSPSELRNGLEDAYWYARRHLHPSPEASNDELDGAGSPAQPVVPSRLDGRGDLVQCTAQFWRRCLAWLPRLANRLHFR